MYFPCYNSFSILEKKEVSWNVENMQVNIV